MKKFPKIETKCNLCNCSGYIDVSYHGSPVYENCDRCKGKEDVVYFRPMTTEEKLNYLLQHIKTIE